MTKTDSSPRRILFVCTARSWGGNEKWSAMAMNSLTERGHTVFLICRNPRIWNDRLSDVTPVAFPLFLHLNPFTYLAVLIRLRRWKIDRVVSTKRTEYVVMGIITRMLGIRHLIRLGIVREMDSRYKRWVYGRLNDGIIVNAARTKNVLGESPAIDPSKVHLIYNGIPKSPTARAEITANAEQPATSRPFRIVSIGALHPRKGFDKLIEAVAGMPGDSAAGVELVVVGDGPARSDLEHAAARAGLADRVRFTGFLADPGPELDEADLFALITENEGISNALLEAMARGVPVLTTDAGGTGDFLVDGMNGFFTESDPSAVAARLVHLRNRDDLTEVGIRGRKTVLDFFSLSRMTDDLEEFLDGPKKDAEADA